MKKTILIVILLVFVKTVFAQKITYNYLIDTSNIEVKKVQKLFENYIHSRPDSVYNNPYWTDSEKNKVGHFDVLYGEFQPSLYMGFPIHVLSIKSNKGTFQIKAMFSKCNSDTPFVLCIANFYAKKENENYKLYNALYINRKLWQSTKVGLITFYYPNYHKFNSKKAEELNKFVLELCKNLQLENKPFEYYFADNYDELVYLKGMDYYIGMGGEEKPRGLGGNGRTFCSGMGENYFHEPFHVLVVDKKYTSHMWVAEGMATYLGGSRGKPLSWHINRVNSYLILHPEIDLNNLLFLRTMDEYTDYRYVFGGLIAKKIFEKGGWPLIRQFMNSGFYDEDYYNAIEKYLGIKRNDLNTYLRNQLGKESNK
jgi:hypothetical protein